MKRTTRNSIIATVIFLTFNHRLQAASVDFSPRADVQVRRTSPEGERLPGLEFKSKDLEVFRESVGGETMYFVYLEGSLTSSKDRLVLGWDQYTIALPPDSTAESERPRPFRFKIRIQSPQTQIFVTRVDPLGATSTELLLLEIPSGAPVRSRLREAFFTLGVGPGYLRATGSSLAFAIVPHGKFRFRATPGWDFEGGGSVWILPQSPSSTSLDLGLRTRGWIGNLNTPGGSFFIGLGGVYEKFWLSTLGPEVSFGARYTFNNQSQLTFQFRGALLAGQGLSFGMNNRLIAAGGQATWGLGSEGHPFSVYGEMILWNADLSSLTVSYQGATVGLALGI